jgi:hypothetical protein
MAKRSASYPGLRVKDTGAQQNLRMFARHRGYVLGAKAFGAALWHGSE